MRQFTTRRRLAALLTGGAALLVAGSLLNRSTESAQTSDESPARPLPVQVVVAEQVRSFDQTRYYTGALVARRSADVSFERAARVVEILVDEGDAVVTGQELAKLDVRRLETRQLMVQAQYDAAAAQLRELVAGPRTETIAAARARVQELKSQLELSRLTHHRTEKLQARQSTSGQSVDNSRLSMAAATARLIQAQQRLTELETGTRPEQIASQQAMVNQLSAQLDDLQLDRSDSILTAPFAGRISRRHIDEGTVTAPGQPVVSLTESTAIEARIGLPAGSIRRFSKDNSVALQVEGETIHAVFARVLPEVDFQTRTQIAVFDFSEEDSLKVAAGQTVRISLSEETAATGYWLPTSALSPGQRGLWSACVVVNKDNVDRIETRPVEILHTEGKRVLVTGTIRKGDRVIAGGVQRIVPGQEVAVAK
jgi:multidrug efflux pump subunit AcrA (membrane-fusion protein)